MQVSYKSIRKRLVPALALILALSVGSANACGLCVYSLADPHVPIVPITAVSVAWYIVSVILTRIYGIQNTGMGLLFAAAAVVGGVLVSAMLGPMSLVPLGLLAAILWFRSLRKTSSENDGSLRKGYVVLRWTGVLALVTLVSWGAWDRSDKRDWRTADWLNRWEGTALGRQLLTKLVSAGPAALDEARDVVDRSTDYDSARAAEILARHGDPATDVPRMLALQQRLEQKSKYMAWAMHEPLSKATGLKLESDATAYEWEQAWLLRRERLPN